MSPPPAAVTGGSIGPHARRNYGEGKSSPPAGDFVACGLLERRRRSKTSAAKVAEQCGPPPHSLSGKLQPSRGLAAIARQRGGRSRTERFQDSFAFRIELLGFKRQSRPGPCHVGQDGAHPQVRRAISHLPAFDGTLSALDRSNHRHPAGHAHRPRVVRRHYTTTATGLPTCNAVGMKKSIAMSRTPDRRAALAPRFRLMEPAPAVGLAQPITMPQPRAGRANLRPPAAFQSKSS
jgi:hypothetical protein